MSNQKKHISEADYRRYLNDEMTGEERNAFEKLLQKQPFEAEALEGLQEISADEFTRDMFELKQRLQQKTQKSNRMIWWASAASVIVIIVSGVLWYNIDRDIATPQVTEQIATRNSSEKTETNDEKSGVTIPVSKSHDRPEGVEKDKKESDKEANTSLPSRQKEEGNTQVIVVENERVGTGAVYDAESPLENSATAISGSKTTVKPDLKPVEEIVFVEDDFVMDSEAAESAIARQAEVITSAAVDSQNPEVFIKARPIMIKEEFEKWMESQAVLEKGNPANSVIVELILHIDETGKITKFENTNQADQKYFRKARKIIRNGPAWQPAMQNGIPIKSVVEKRVVFRKK